MGEEPCKTGCKFPALELDLETFKSQQNLLIRQNETRCDWLSVYIIRSFYPRKFIFHHRQLFQRLNQEVFDLVGLRFFQESIWIKT